MTAEQYLSQVPNTALHSLSPTGIRHLVTASGFAISTFCVCVCLSFFVFFSLPTTLEQQYLHHF